MVKRLLGITRLPDVSTVSRALARVDQQSVEKIRQLNRNWVLDRLVLTGFSRLTLDFDGAVFSTQGGVGKGRRLGLIERRKGRAVIIRCSAR